MGRVYGLIAASVVLVALLIENGKLYARLATARARERAYLSNLHDPVITINGNGMVLGESEGVVTITCESANGKKATCTVTVKGNNMNPTESYTKSTEPTKSDDAKRHEGSNSSSSKSDESRNDGFIFPHSSQRKLTVDEVTGLGGDVAQDAINEIYARHGYVFKTKSIQKYYESRGWYHKNYNFSESDLSEIESYNIGLLRKYN